LYSTYVCIKYYFPPSIVLVLIKYVKCALIGKKPLNMQSKNDYFKLLVQRNTFLYDLVMFRTITEKYANSYKSLALVIIYDFWLLLYDGRPISVYENAAETYPHAHDCAHRLYVRDKNAAGRPNTARVYMRTGTGIWGSILYAIRM